MASEELSCFVIMPSGGHGEYEGMQKEADFVFAGIVAPALREVFGSEVLIHREVDQRTPGAITRDIVRHTATCPYAIVDITGQNPNVFFELGMRYALRRRTTILLRQPSTPIPFDVTSYRCVEYEPRFDGIAQAQRDIREALRAALDNTDKRSDSLVFDVFPTLSIEIPGHLREPERTGSEQVMPWAEYWSQLQGIVEVIRDQFQNGRYVPSVIVAVSNGGMMYADLLGRELFKGTPIASLWANRWDRDGQYFKNELNDALVEGIGRLGSERRPLQVLVVDDIVASGTTITQALRYLGERVPKAALSFLPLFCKNDKYLDTITHSLLWSKEEFRRPEEPPEQMAKRLHGTSRTKLPYNKDIRSA